MKKKRILSWFMALIMAIGLLPATALAADDTQSMLTEEQRSKFALNDTEFHIMDQEAILNRVRQETGQRVFKSDIVRIYVHGDTWLSHQDAWTQAEDREHQAYYANYHYTHVNRWGVFTDCWNTMNSTLNDMPKAFVAPISVLDDDSVKGIEIVYKDGFKPSGIRNFSILEIPREELTIKHDQGRWGVDINKNITEIYLKGQDVHPDELYNAKYFVLSPTLGVPEDGSSQGWENYYPNETDNGGIEGLTRKTGYVGTIRQDAKDLIDASEDKIVYEKDGLDENMLNEPDDLGYFNADFDGERPAELKDKLASDFKVVWYTMKEEGDGYHVDGYVSGVDVDVTYDLNAPKDAEGFDGEDVNDPAKTGAAYTVLGLDDMEDWEYSDAYVFTGWNTAADGTGAEYAADEVIDPLRTEMKLYAQWDKAVVPPTPDDDDVTLTYHRNAAPEAVEAVDVDKNAVVELADNMFVVPEGKEFAGWALDADAVKADYAAGAEFTAAADTDFYAVWKDAEPVVPPTPDDDDVTLTYHRNAEPEAADVNTYSVGDVVKVKENMFTAPEGKAFMGWAPLPGMAVGGIKPGSDFEVSADADLYAVWGDAETPVDPSDAEKYALIYHANDGTERMYADPAYPEGYPYEESVTVKGADDCEFNAPEGKVFAGWADAPDGKPLTQKGDMFLIRENTNLYAVWKDAAPVVPPVDESMLDVEKELKNPDKKGYKRGEWVDYIITVTNKGTEDMMNVVVTETPNEDVFSAWDFADVDDDNLVIDNDGKPKTVTIKVLKAGETIKLDFSAKVARDAKKGADLVNIVLAEETDNDKNKDKDENDDGSVYVPSGGGGGKHKEDVTIEDLNWEDHFQYVQGYPDQTVRPESNITRAETTVIFYRLLTDKSKENYYTTYNTFPDVNAGDWFNVGISSMANGKFVTGYEDGTFRPNGYITRAEMAVIISNFDDLEPCDRTNFTDIQGHWAEKYINSAVEKGWISGYDDGTYRPDQYITRAETMAMINRVLMRKVNADGLHKDAHQWVDNQPGKWYYYDVLEATNHHEYTREDLDSAESWTSIKPDRVWPN